MPNLRVVNHKKDIQLNNTWVDSASTWVDSASFNKSYLSNVDLTGNPVASTYKGHRYEVIAEKERIFSTSERIGRGFVGILVVVSTVFFAHNLFKKHKILTVFTLPLIAYFSKPVKNLLTQRKETIRFAVLKTTPPTNVEEPPELLFGAKRISTGRELDFALLESEGTKRWVPITFPFSTSPSSFPIYTPYKGSPLEALLELAQEHDRFLQNTNGYLPPIKRLLNHPDNSTITEEAFFKFILDRNNEGFPRICTLNTASTLEVLEMIKEKGIPINLSDKAPSGETLFTLWIGKKQPRITQLILELDPSVIGQLQGKITLIMQTASNGSQREARLLMGAIVQQAVQQACLSEEELWAKKAFENDCNFSDQEFTRLNQDLKIKIYFLANAFVSEGLVIKLNALGMREEPLFFPGPAIFSDNMDVVTTKNVMENFLKGLRKNGLLLTQEEFSRLDLSKHFKKMNQIGRIQGKFFIERLVKENGLKHIKVPKKFAVINNGLQSISFRVDKYLELKPTIGQLLVYAECVEAVDRKLSLEEALEFMIILETTGYSDFAENNFIYAKDGIYFIDTEFDNFFPSEPKFDSIKVQILASLATDEDKALFFTEWDKRKRAYEADFDDWVSSYSKLTTGYQEHVFTFQLSSLLGIPS